MENGFILLITISVSLLTAFIIYPIPDDKVALRTVINISGAVIKFCIVLFIMALVADNKQIYFKYRIGEFFLSFNADPLAIFFLFLSSFLWIVTTIYAVGYLEDSEYRSRFFTFYSLCITATAGISLAGDLITFYIFYEMLTITTYPLVVHNGNKESMDAGKIYMIYTISGGLLILVATIMLYSTTGKLSFTTGGILVNEPQNNYLYFIIYILFLFGFGVKSAFFPLHYWLPRAMVAPAPVSALLHAVAVVKAGVFGILRITYDIFGLEIFTMLSLDTLLFILSSTTIIYGSIMALKEKNIKKRLAYSTVSQLSYIPFGISLGTLYGEIGGVVHIVHQGLMKITLFLCAGVFYKIYGIKYVDEIAGIGKRMPITMLTFTISALGMIGIPPTTGFISKIYLGIGSFQHYNFVGISILILSSALNSFYFLPLIYKGWFTTPTIQMSRSNVNKTYLYFLIAPLVITSSLVILCGVFASFYFSPLSWAERIVKINYGLFEK